MNFRQKRRIVVFIALFIGVCCIWISGVVPCKCSRKIPKNLLN